MINEIGKERLHSRLYPDGEDVWSVIKEIADTKEDDRRRLLRPHAEMGFGTDDESMEAQNKRRRLDVALGGLTALEIAYETGVVTEKEEAVPEFECFKRLIESEAFLRYVNAYLYFGIRFLAWRIMRPKCYIAPEAINAERRKTLEPRDTNRQFLQLKTPPQLKDVNADSKFAALVYLADRETKISQVQALSFLDGFTAERKDTKSPQYREDSASEPDRFELWLRGLSPPALTSEENTEERRFWAISQGLIEWAIARRDFYVSLQQAEGKRRPEGGWVVTNPLAARFALADLYWISRLLKAEVSANATVTYARSNWLHLLRFRIGLSREETKHKEADLQHGVDLLSEIWKAEEVLRSVFDFVCDLIQNAVEITEESEKRALQPELFTKWNKETAKWRKVFDEELDEINKQRNLREFREPISSADGTTGGSGGAGNAVSSADDDWMERIRTDKPIHNLVGLSFSGGGIRSATFNLGVLQGLQELDLLRRIDYISTVSGGGFIGSWLVANVYRTKHWLGRLMNWETSIDHLRKYSNYLAPRLGMFSTDTWTMWASWARNAFLIQMTCLAWLWAALVFAILGHGVFERCGTKFFFALAVVLMCILLVSLCINLSGNRPVSGGKKGKQMLGPWTEFWIWVSAILPAWGFSFFFASRMWRESNPSQPEAPAASAVEGVINNIQASAIGRVALLYWQYIIWIALAVLAYFTLSRLAKPRASEHRPGGYPRLWRIFHAIWIGLLCAKTLTYELKGLLWLFSSAKNPEQYSWYAYVLGPPLVLLAHTLSVVIFIGLCGRNSKEAVREWWTRFGASLGKFGAAYLGLTTAAIYGPPWMLYLWSLGAVKWGSALTWAGTVIGGLLAGKSSRTVGNGLPTKSPWLEWLAKAGGFVFIVGAILIASTGLYLVMARMGDASEWNSLGYWATLPHISRSSKLMTLAACLLLGYLFSHYFEINIFGLNQFYRFRLVRCYLGATRWVPGFRKAQPFTSFDGEDDERLSSFSNWKFPDEADNAASDKKKEKKKDRNHDRDKGDKNKKEEDKSYRGPFPIFNCSLNLSGSSDLALHTRHSASFSLTPLRCGADRRLVGYAPTPEFSGGIMLGQAVAISGAAASPNMGFNTSPLVAFLLTMFNVRLGWWFPNPAKRAWDRPGLNFSLYYLLCELFGVADEKRWYVNVSDGGHFENLGVYELIRRRCKVIIVCDAECDEHLQFGSLGNVVRLCETDFAAKIDIDVNSIRQQKDSFSLSHCTIGHVFYSNGSMGYIVYLKSSITGDEDVGVTQYRSVHPSFPHETTADQFFSEHQFESYRKLGLHVVQHSLRATQPGDHPAAIAEKLADVLVPSGCSSEAFVKHTKTLDGIWERFRETPELHPFFEELMRLTLSTPETEARIFRRRETEEEEKIIGLEMIQLMENVFLDLRLDDFWSHPDNRGWAILFMRWARSPRFREIWKKTRRTFGIRFEYFCAARLGLERDDPIVRV